MLLGSMKLAKFSRRSQKDTWLTFSDFEHAAVTIDRLLLLLLALEKNRLLRHHEN